MRRGGRLPNCGCNISKWYVPLAKKLCSEKTGNLEMQLYPIKQMLLFFHVCGRNNYAKSAHIYVQDMQDYIENV